MKITVDNYETYVIDYLEGNLDSLLRSEFEVFLQKNPEIKEEVEECSGIVLQSKPDVTYDAKINLYRSDDLEDSILSVVEGIATNREEEYITNLSKKDKEVDDTLRLYRLIKLIPDQSIVCDFKESLYKKRIVWDFAKKAISIAATILLFIGIHQVVVSPSFEEHGGEMSQSEEYNKSFMPPKYTIEREIYRKDRKNEGIAQVESPKHIEEVKQVIQTAKEIEATYASVREPDQMEYIEPVGISFETSKVDVKEILIPDSNEQAIDVTRTIDFATKPDKLKYDVKEELDQPLHDEVIGEKKEKRRRFFQKVGTTIASISNMYYE